MRRICKPCIILENKAWAKNNPHKLRARELRRDYNMTVEQYDAMLEAQGGVCAICKKACASKSRLSVDHDHETDEVRGLLCANCNHGLGHFMDSPELLRAALLYLAAQSSSHAGIQGNRTAPGG